MKKENNKKQMIDRDPRHPEKKLVTRRDFMSAGVIGLGGAVVLPSIFDLVFFERAARAGECPSASGGSGMLPFLTIDVAGGCSLAGNWMPSSQEGLNGAHLQSYDSLGLMGDGSGYVPDTTFGAPMAAPSPVNPTNFSAIFAALTNDMNFPPNIRKCLRMTVIAAPSLSDSGTNQLSAISLVTQAGLRGSSIQSALGMRNSNSGGNSDVASFFPSTKAMGVSSIDSLTTALSYGPALGLLNTKLKDSLANTLIKLSYSQAQKLASMRLGDQFASLAQCGYIKNAGYTGAAVPVDARSDAAVASIYGISMGTSASDSNAIIATIVKNSLEKTCGAGVIQIGGGDYHSGNRTDGTGKDTEVGNHIAMMCRVAFAKNQKFMFHLITDGGLSSDGQGNWISDSNGRTCTIVGVFDPALASDPSATIDIVSHQIGRFTSGQSADTNHILSSSPIRVAHATFVNYLALHGQVGRYASLSEEFGSDALPGDLNQYLMYPNKS